MSEQDEQVAVDATSTTDDQDIELNLDDVEDVEALKAQVAEKDTFARQAVARAKKAEAELKEFKTPKPAEPTQKALSEEDVEVKILLAKGIDSELIDEMKTLAKVRKTNLLQVENDPIFKAMKEEREAKAKIEKSKLGASRGSGSVKPQKRIDSPGLSREEHKAMFLEALNN